MFQDTLIGEGAIHAYNNLPANANTQSAAAMLQEFAEYANVVSPPGYHHPDGSWQRDYQPGDIEQILFAESDVDFGVYHSLPIFDFFSDGWSSLEKGVRLRDANPERIKLLGCVDPMSDSAKDAMEQQVDELGVDGFKFYPTYVREGKVRPLRLDEELLPLVETAHSLGIEHIAVHKLFPIGPVGMHHLGVGDVADIATLFPEMTFELLHPDLAFLHEITSMLGTHPNVWVNLELTTGYMFLQPRRFAEILGELLMWAPDRVIFGTGLPLVHPQGYIEHFWEFEMPADLQEGYHYPSLTDELKRDILGNNLLRLYGWDESELKSSISDDRWARERAISGRDDPWSIPDIGGVTTGD